MIIWGIQNITIQTSMRAICSAWLVSLVHGAAVVGQSGTLVHIRRCLLVSQQTGNWHHGHLSHICRSWPWIRMTSAENDHLFSSGTEHVAASENKRQQAIQ